MLPFIIGSIGAVIGALYIGMVFQTAKRRLSVGVALGAIGGTLGAISLMIPLNFCTFDAERELAQNIFGVLLIITGMLIVLLPMRWLAVNGFAGLTAGQSTQGVFKSPVLPWLLLAPTLAVLIFFLYYPF